jgi:multiple sugar transport system permease protein
MKPFSRHKITLLVGRFTVAAMLAPYLFGMGGLVLIPAALALAMAFTEYNALTPPSWVGIDNFANLWSDRLFWIALAKTILYLIFAVPLRLGGALLLALLYRHQQPGIGMARIAVYLPTVIPNVAYGLIWLISFNPQYGPINLLLGYLSLPRPAWTFEPWPALWALVIMAAWQLGECFVILLATARNIPGHLYEASSLDGAGVWVNFRYLTMPLLLPSIILLSARDLIVCLQANFVPSLIVTQGGPGYSTLFVPLYTYWLAFDDLRFGYAAAVVWTLYLLFFCVVIVQFAGSRRWHYERGF